MSRCKHQLNPKKCRICNPDIVFTADDFNKLTDEVISYLANDDYSAASEGIRELAHLCKSGDWGKQSFVNYCKYIEKEAMKTNPNPEFIRYKLKEALRPKEIIMVH